MNKNERKALEILKGRGEMGTTVSTVSSQLGITKNGTRKLLLRLVKEKLLTGEQQTKLRVWRFKITEKGNQKLKGNQPNLF